MMLPTYQRQPARSRFDFDATLLCRGDDASLYRVVRRQQLVLTRGLDGRAIWRRTHICNYSLLSGQPVALLADGRLLLLRQGVMLAPL